MNGNKSAQLTVVAEHIRVPTSFGDEWERWIARRRLHTLCKHLDSLLASPVHLANRSSIRLVTAMGCVGYRIDYRQRTITPGHVHPDGCFEVTWFRVEVFRPLCTSLWLRWMIADLGLSDDGSQLNLFISDDAIEQQVEWLANTSYRLLRRHPVFERLRRYDLPKALHLNPELARIGLQSRPATRWLNADEYERVWQNSRFYQRVAQENSRLLPVVSSYLAAYESTAGTKVVAEVKRVFRNAGLSEAAWRYLTRHGWRLFKVPWEMSYGQSAFDIALQYLITLDRAGLPPPPPPSLVRAWFRIYVAADFDRVRSRGWSELPDYVLRPGLIEANRLRASPALSDFIDTFLSVVNWALETDPDLDQNQRRAGWPWLVRRTREWEAGLKLECMENNRTWRSRIGPFRRDDFTVKPLLSSAELLLEARRMRNCLTGYDKKCAAGLVRIFSIRNDAAKRPLADIGIGFDARSQRWELTECKGFANRPVGRRIHALGAELAWRFSS